MVTVIATKEELTTTTPVNNGVTGGGSCDNGRPFQFIKDYQEVDFHRSPSCKPLPENLFEINDGHSIKGTFFVQIDGIQMSNNQNEHHHILLTLTDGILTVKAITNDSIPNLTFNTKSGSKLLLTDNIPIQNGVLQLTHDNTRFQYGSNTYPRPRSTNYRGRGGGSYRPSYEGRRNSRHDNDDGESNLLKRPPPKNTLMDFMTSLKISNDNENEKPTKRQYNENNDQIIYQQDGIDEQLDSEDDPSHANYRERRNPLPPRLQRAQEERSRRNTNRYYDESIPSGNDINSIYRNDTTSNQSLSSTSASYIRRADQSTFISNNSSVPLNTYAQSGNILTNVNGSTPTHLAYFQANPGSLTYNLPSFHNQQTIINSSYPNEHFNYCCGIPYATNSNYLSTNVNNDSKINGNIYSDNENSIYQNDENNDSGIKSETSSNEQKLTPPSLSNEDKHRDLNTNTRLRWKIGDMCLARWSEDGEFYYATIVEIQPPYCTVLFVEYNHYDQVHFNDLKIIARDQQFYPFIPPSSDLNILAANAYFPPRTSYYPSTIDGCIIMPEAPPFPFNSAGTLYMYPPSSLTTTSCSNGIQNENCDLTINSSSSPSKDSNDTSAIDSTTTSNDENLSLPRPCSIADTPLTLVTSDDLYQRNLSLENEQQLTKEEEKRE